MGRKRFNPPHSCDSGPHQCSGCGQAKPCDEFPPEKRSKKGWSWCYRCRADHSAKWRKEHHEEYLADQKQRYDPDKARDFTLRKLYGITLVEYRAECDRRDNRCDICHRESTDGILRVDHNHDTNELRGYLCDRCNRAIGLFGDDPVTIAAAAAYLQAVGHYGIRQVK